MAVTIEKLTRWQWRRAIAVALLGPAGGLLAGPPILALIFGLEAPHAPPAWIFIVVGALSVLCIGSAWFIALQLALAPKTLTDEFGADDIEVSQEEALPAAEAA